MTRHTGWDVRISPDVIRAVRDTTVSGGSTPIRAQFVTEIDRLQRFGTRANGVKKMRSLDLWEIRSGDRRVFFCLGPHAGMIAVGAIERKTSKRLRMTKLQTVERKVHRWRDQLEESA